MLVAIRAVGEGLLGPERAAIASFTLGLLLTFLAVRVNTRLIRAKVSWWFHDIESDSGLHVHHMVVGVILLVVSGLALIALSPRGLLQQAIAFAFGAGVALTLDEFALILRLQDVYWTREGRLSVDAVVVAVCTGILLLLGATPLGVSEFGTVAGTAAYVVFALTLSLHLCTAILCLIKGKLWTGFFAIFIPIVGIIGAVRVARPLSPWARWRYARKPARLAKAQRREEHVNATWRAWRETFFDLLAGKPHLPSVTQAPARGEPDEMAPEAPTGRPPSPDEDG
jgi:lysyl-tRNA synthetase class 2